MIVNDNGKYRSQYIKRHKTSQYNDKSIYLIAPHLDLDGIFELIDGYMKDKPISHYIPNDILLKVFNKEIILALDLSAESLYRHIDIIYDTLIVKNGIPESQLLIISGSEDIYQKIITKSKEVNKKPCLFEYYYFYQDGTNKMLHEQLTVNYKSPLCRESHSHKYINLNNKWRWHRIALLTLLKGDDLLHQGLNSLSKVRNLYGVTNDFITPHDTLQAAKQETGVYGKLWYNNSKNGDLTDVWNLWFDETISKFPDQELNIIMNNGHDLIEKIPLRIDIDSNFARSPLIPYNVILPEGSYIGLAHFYHKTFFSIVTETHYFNDMATHISEKTYKAMILKHPFIVVSTPYFLKHLQNLGFKTFSPYIDESYDDEFDDTKRMKLILKEIKRLCNLSDDDYKSFKKSCLDIVNYNFDLLADKTNFIKSI